MLKCPDNTSYATDIRSPSLKQYPAEQKAEQKWMLPLNHGQIKKLPHPFTCTENSENCRKFLDVNKADETKQTKQWKRFMKMYALKPVRNNTALFATMKSRHEQSRSESFLKFLKMPITSKFAGTGITHCSRNTSWRSMKRSVEAPNKFPKIFYFFQVFFPNLSFLELLNRRVLQFLHQRKCWKLLMNAQQFWSTRPSKLAPMTNLSKIDHSWFGKNGKNSWPWHTSTEKHLPSTEKISGSKTGKSENYHTKSITGNWPKSFPILNGQ